MLPRRNRAKFNRRLWPQLGEHWGAQQRICPNPQEIDTFTDIITPDLGVALVNLHLHGCVDVQAANQLCDLGLAVPATFARRVPGYGLLSFDALELELAGYIEINRIDQARAIRHRFVQDAVARMAVDQFAGEDKLVFERCYLEGLAPNLLAAAHEASLQSWRR